MNIANAPDTPRAREECVRLKRYIEALKQAHQKEIDGLLAQARQQARQIAELRMEAGHGAAAAAAANAVGRGSRQSAGQGTGKTAAKSAGGAVLTVEDIVPLAPPPCSRRHAG